MPTIDRLLGRSVLQRGLTACLLLFCAACNVKSNLQLFDTDDFVLVPQPQRLDDAWNVGQGGGIADYGRGEISQSRTRTYIFRDEDGATCELGLVPIPEVDGDYFLVTNVHRECAFNGQDYQRHFHYVLVKYDAGSDNPWRRVGLPPGVLASDAEQREAGKQLVALARSHGIRISYHSWLFGNSYFIRAAESKEGLIRLFQVFLAEGVVG